MIREYYEKRRLKLERALHPDCDFSSAIYMGNDFMPYKISVYCPTFNRVDLLLNRALPSVLAQTYTNFEFLIVDDCSTDKTTPLVAASCIKSNEHRVRLLKTANRKKRYPETVDNHWMAGPVVPANLALENCQGEFIARIDDDDVWEPDHLETLLNFAIYRNAEFVSSAYHEKGVYHGLREGETTGGASSFFYRSYLKFFKYDINCWKKKNNRVNDLDLLERMEKAGVRMEYSHSSTYSIDPRPGETEIGSKAYRNNEEMILSKYKFKG